MRTILLLSIAWIMLSVLGACSDESTTGFDYRPDEVNADSLWEAGQAELKPGIQDAMIKVNFQRRNFRYYMPENLKSEGVALIFDFHGNMPWDPTNPYNPVGGFNEYFTCCKMADTANFIVVKPVGAIVPDAGVLGWNDTELNALFVDKMVEYFKSGCKGLDLNRIYATGISSGGIFCFGLASLRSELFAAIVPLAGQYSIGSSFVKPSRVVPMLTMVGSYDYTVDPGAAYDNFASWAVNVGGYEADAFTKEQTEVYGRWTTYDVEVTAWSGGKADLQFWLLNGASHSIEEDASWPAAWEFMRTHPKR